MINVKSENNHLENTDWYNRSITNQWIWKKMHCNSKKRKFVLENVLEWLLVKH